VVALFSDLYFLAISLTSKGIWEFSSDKMLAGKEKEKEG